MLTSRSAAIVAAITRIGSNIGLATVRVFCAIVVMTASAQALEATESAIKAAFLYKFGFFVKWPQAAFAANDSPINLCIVGDDPFGSLLDDTIKGQKIGERTIVVHRMNAVAPDSGCHIAYIANSADTHSSRLLATLRGRDVLTVTDARTGEGDVGIINFVIKDNRVRFDIDEDAAASGGLVISSRLLEVALEVKSRH
jgi:hypothetical protein